jgi:geranylgeranyl diphosphate synthase, type I
LALGGALAGASNELLRGYSAFALPLGEAFQLRDDVLGVFGDPLTTGKPAGDDLREGKRTVLVALALDQASAAESAFIDARLGSPDLTDEDIREIRRIIEESGALQATEVLINEFGEAAFDALEMLPLDDLPKTALRRLAEATVSRAS